MPGSVRRTPATSKQKRLAAAPAFFVGAGSLGLRASGRLREAVSEAPTKSCFRPAPRSGVGSANENPRFRPARGTRVGSAN